MSATIKTHPIDIKAHLALQEENKPLLDVISNILIYEAWLLDNGHHDEWLDLLADDLRYLAPVRRKIYDETLTLSLFEDGKPYVSYFNDGKPDLGLRVKRLGTGQDHYNRPPPLQRRVIGNIMLLEVLPAQISVTSNFMVFRAREEKEEALFVGARDDIWRRTDAGWRLARRLIKFDHHIVPPISQLF
jgi:3-phenylpropionate/cinnamic acid dioxygenase small subunit